MRVDKTEELQGYEWVTSGTPGRRTGLTISSRRSRQSFLAKVAIVSPIEKDCVVHSPLGGNKADSNATVGKRCSLILVESTHEVSLACGGARKAETDRLAAKGQVRAVELGVCAHKQ